MVGKSFRVVFTQFAQSRRLEIFEFEEKLNGRSYAHKVQQAIDKAAKRLEKLPESNPLYESHDSEYEIRYTKALAYKVLFRVLNNAGDVVIITIRNDAENPNRIKEEL